MAIVRKFTIGVQPFAKSFRMHGLGGVATDAVLRLRGKSLPDDFFSDIGVNTERTVYRLSSEDQTNSLQLTEDSVSFTKDYYEAKTSFDFRKVLEEFRVLWSAVDGVLKMVDIRRIGMVAEYRYSVDDKNASVWLRSKLTAIPTKLATDKLTMRFEEREFAKDGGIPDPKKADFLNCIYTIYDSTLDVNHPTPGFVDVDVDAQRYYTPLLNGNVSDEVLKLHKHFESSQRKINEFLMSLGATHGKK